MHAQVRPPGECRKQCEHEERGLPAPAHDNQPRDEAREDEKERFLDKRRRREQQPGRNAPAREKCAHRPQDYRCRKRLAEVQCSRGREPGAQRDPKPEPAVTADVDRQRCRREGRSRRSDQSENEQRHRYRVYAPGGIAIPASQPSSGCP